VKYYQVLFCDKYCSGVASTSQNQQLFTLPYVGAVEFWVPIVLELREGDFSDYLSSTLGCRLCSPRLRNILDEYRSVDDEIQWLPVTVRKGEMACVYAVLHFPHPPDVLNKDKSIFAGEFVVKPVLSRTAVENHHVFAYPKAGEAKLFISGQVKMAIESAGCTGMELSCAAIH
jgi:hypothetical protein